MDFQSVAAKVGVRYGEVTPEIEEHDDHVSVKFSFGGSLDPQRAEYTVKQHNLPSERSSENINLSKYEPDELEQLLVELGVCSKEQVEFVDSLDTLQFHEEDERISKEGDEYILTLELVFQPIQLEVTVTPASSFVSSSSASFKTWKRNVNAQDYSVHQNEDFLLIEIPITEERSADKKPPANKRLMLKEALKNSRDSS